MLTSRVYGLRFAAFSKICLLTILRLLPFILQTNFRMRSKSLGLKIIGKSSRISIFKRDSELDKCLVYKINRITGLDFVFNDDLCFICVDCRLILAKIHRLEEKLANLFNQRNEDDFDETYEQDDDSVENQSEEEEIPGDITIHRGSF